MLEPLAKAKPDFQYTIAKIVRVQDPRRRGCQSRGGGTVTLLGLSQHTNATDIKGFDGAC